MNDAPLDVRRCTRNTKTGARCRKGQVLWPSTADLPDPAACDKHLTPEERAIDVEYRRQWQAECDRMLLPYLLQRAGDPACWSWPVPDETHIDALTPEARAAAMYAWHQGRCAICGHAAVVTDHDHGTAMVRGRLCHSCNIGEAYGNLTRDVFVKYRERNPASIWGVREVYYNSFTHEYAEPAPAYDRWRDNPMKGIGL